MASDHTGSTPGRHPGLVPESGEGSLRRRPWELNCPVTAQISQQTELLPFYPGLVPGKWGPAILHSVDKCSPSWGWGSMELVWVREGPLGSVLRVEPAGSGSPCRGRGEASPACSESPPQLCSPIPSPILLLWDGVHRGPDVEHGPSSPLPQSCRSLML